MGGSSSEVEVDESIIRPNEYVYYTPSGVQCVFKDSGEYAGRLRQLELINHAIQTLSSRLWMDPKLIDFEDLHRDTMTYKDVDGIPSPATHPWSMLSRDDSFRSGEQTINRFQEYEQYMVANAGADRVTMHLHMTNFLTLFIRWRNWLMGKMLQECTTE